MTQFTKIFIDLGAEFGTFADGERDGVVSRPAEMVLGAFPVVGAFGFVEVGVEGGGGGGPV